jgi:UDP-N-acetyl-D-galactosamine dehydrogenase
VYPGFSKNIFINYLEKNTNLKNNKDFFFGYSPERINPGDKIHTIDNIAKIVAYETDNKLIKNRIKKIYKTISKNIVYSNKINETEISKVIENIQRDINIAFINEILVLCKKMKLEFKEVIKLANTKWNFLNFKPGLVGGHCLPINSHYLSWSAGTMMNKSSLILSARETNDSMKDFIISEVKYSLKIKNLSIKKSKLLFVGISYKAGVSDLRNSLNLEIYNYFKKNNKNIFALDPFLSRALSQENNISKKIKDFTKFNVVIFLSYHNDFKKIYYNLKKLKNNKIIILDPFNFY